MERGGASLGEGNYLAGEDGGHYPPSHALAEAGTL